MSQKIEIQNEDISLFEVIKKIKLIWSYLLTKWVKTCVVIFFGAIVGLLYAWLQPIKYISKMTFVLEDGKAGVGGLASLAGQFGIDLGGAGGGSVFSADNILIFLKSESLIRETLFTMYSIDSKMTLADKYAEVNHLKNQWAKKKEIGLVQFNRFSLSNLPRKEDSLLQEITQLIVKEDLIVTKPDKKASFIEVKTIMPDELLSKYFSERLVQIATKRYIYSKTKTKVANVQKLENKADSLVAILNNRTYAAATNQQQLVDINPALKTAPILSEISSRDKTIAATLYAEVVKNLELSKTLLNQETPVIEMVDQSSLPLEEDKVGKLKGFVFGGLLFGASMIVYLVISYLIRSRLQDLV